MKERLSFETRSDARAGFTLIEIVVGLSVLVVATLALGLSLQAGAIAARELREGQVILGQAQTLVDRLLAVPFGLSTDPDPTSAQIAEVFDPDSEPGTVTLFQLSRSPPGDGGWKFSLADFPVPGEWRVLVDRDLNDNGIEDGELETSQRVFRISVFFENSLVLQTVRAREVSL